MESSNPTLRRVLIIDDDYDFRKILQVWITSQFPNTEVIEYDPVEQGIPDQNFNWSVYDVLLLDYDLQLKQTNGLEILRANHSNENFPSTIMLTAAGNEIVAVQAFKLEVTDYLRKESVNMEQIKTAIENAFTQKLLKIQRANMLEISREIAKAESEKIIYDLINQYEKEHEQEHLQVKIENEKIRARLLKSQQMLKKFEQEKEQAEKSKQVLMKEMENLKSMLQKATDKSEVIDKLESTHNKLEQAEASIDRIHESYQIIKSEIDKNLWKKEQDVAFQQELKNDLEAFENEFEQHKQQMSGINTKLKKEMLDKMKKLKIKRSEEEIKEQELFRDITSQLHDREHPGKPR